MLEIAQLARDSHPARVLGAISSSRCQKPRTLLSQRAKTDTSGRADDGLNSTDWWSQTGSNRRPPACKAGALPTELWPLVQRQAQIRLQPSPRMRERRLVGLGRFELPTSRLSSARSNQLSYKPESWRTAEQRARSMKTVARRISARARPRRKRNGDGGVPPVDIYGLNRSALMFPRDPIATA
jgi:hypothetical protein